MLLALLLLPLGIIFYIIWQQRRRRVVAAYGSFGFGPQAAGGPGRRRHIPPLLFLAGFTLLLLALARPEMVVQLPQVEGTIILAFDVSGSMAADDLEPTRMEAAKSAARQFVAEQPPTVLIGVVAFSDSGFAVQAPTDDREEILATIDRLGPQLGTSLANGIFASLNTLTPEEEPAARLYSDLTPTPTPPPTPVPAGVYAPAAIVLLTDGENNEMPDPLAAAQTAADQGVRIYTIGIGSATGTTLQIDGFTVHTRLDEAMLQRISELTGGTYHNAVNEKDLATIYGNLDPQLVVKPEKLEITSVLAGISILVLLTGGAVSLAWFNRLA
jgi:Ca-activated chloride channel family protein